jgi:hypothetical protein
LRQWSATDCVLENPERHEGFRERIIRAKHDFQMAAHGAKRPFMPNAIS